MCIFLGRKFIIIIILMVLFCPTRATAQEALDWEWQSPFLEKVYEWSDDLDTAIELQTCDSVMTYTERTFYGTAAGSGVLGMSSLLLNKKKSKVICIGSAIGLFGVAATSAATYSMARNNRETFQRKTYGIVRNYNFTNFYHAVVGLQLIAFAPDIEKTGLYLRTQNKFDSKDPEADWTSITYGGLIESGDRQEFNYLHVRVNPERYIARQAPPISNVILASKKVRDIMAEGPLQIALDTQASLPPLVSLTAQCKKIVEAIRLATFDLSDESFISRRLFDRHKQITDASLDLHTPAYVQRCINKLAPYFVRE